MSGGLPWLWAASSTRAPASAQAITQVTDTTLRHGPGRRARRSCRARRASGLPLNTTCVTLLLRRSTTDAPSASRRFANTGDAFRSPALVTSTRATTPRRTLAPASLARASPGGSAMGPNAQRRLVVCDTRLPGGSCLNLRRGPRRGGVRPGSGSDPSRVDPTAATAFAPSACNLCGITPSPLCLDEAALRRGRPTPSPPPRGAQIERIAFANRWPVLVAPVPRGANANALAPVAV